MIDFKNGVFFKLRQSNVNLSEVSQLLVPGEQVISTYVTVRDYVVFTDRRIISVNVQGVTGKKKDFTSLPYSKIQVFSVETAGVLDVDSELDMFFSGLGKVRFEFTGRSNIQQIGQLISNYVLR